MHGRPAPERRCNNALAIWLMALSACSPAAGPEAVRAPVAATAMAVAPTPAPSSTPAPTNTPVPSATPTPSPTTTPVPTPTPDPVAGLTIPDLRARDYGDGAIKIGELYRRGPGYSTYRMSYPTDGLRLTGLLHVPDGDGPFPLII